MTRIIEMAAVIVAKPSGLPSVFRYDEASEAGGVKERPSVAQKLRVSTNNGQSSLMPRKFSTHCPDPSACPLTRKKKDVSKVTREEQRKEEKKRNKPEQARRTRRNSRQSLRMCHMSYYTADRGLFRE